MAAFVLTPPRWARVADAVTVALFAIAIDIALSGGVAFSFGAVRLSVRSPGRVFIAAAVVAIIRHGFFRSWPLHLRLARTVCRMWRNDAAPIALGAFASRVAIVLVGFFAVVTFGLSKPEIGFTLSDDPLLNLPARFDAGWYGTIAQDGYAFKGAYDRQQNIAFFPAFPLLMRAAAVATGGFTPGVPKPWRNARMLWGGVLLSMAGFAWACVYLFRLARDLGLANRAATAVWLLAAYPFATYFSAAYTEAVFLLGSVGAFYHFRRREWLRSAAWGLVVGLTRPNGCFLSVALAVLLLEEWRAQSNRGSNSYPFLTSVATAAAPGVGMLIYSAYIKTLTGSWFGWARVQEAWGRSFEGVAPIARGIGWISSDGLLRVVSNVPFDTLNAAAVLFAIVMVWPIWRRLGPAWAVFVLINVVTPLVGGGVLSLGRMTSSLFPLFLALAAILPEAFVPAVLVAFAVGQGLTTALFFTWRPMF